MARNREDWLYEQLEDQTLSAELRADYDAELDVLAARLDAALDRQATRVKAEVARRAEIRAKMAAEDMDYVWALGEAEFKDDYEIVAEGTEFILYSKVARDDQSHRRPHPSLEAAQKDLRYLYWNRIYTNYVRTGEADSVVDVA